VQVRPENVIVSLTSVPKRFGTTLPVVLAATRQQSVKLTTVVSLPQSYRKWGAPPPFETDMDGVRVFRPSRDHGPATKLLGGLEYAAENPEISHIITIDDDVVPGSARLFEYLIACAKITGGAVTAGGIRLKGEPYRGSGEGLSYKSRFERTHIPSGYRCVIYPVRPLLQSDLPFRMIEDMPAGTFNDDDAFFGCLLGALSIGLVGVPAARPRNVQGDGGSAVEEDTSVHRIDNQAEIFRHGVEQGFLPMPLPSVPVAVRLKLAAAFMRTML
jgi:hypothetical protein